VSMTSSDFKSEVLSGPERRPAKDARRKVGDRRGDSGTWRHGQPGGGAKWRCAQPGVSLAAAAVPGRVDGDAIRGAGGASF
jgi:hypothetical protein